MLKVLFLFVFFSFSHNVVFAKSNVIAIIGNKDALTEKDLIDFIKLEMILSGAKKIDENVVNSAKVLFFDKFIDEKIILYHAKKQNMDLTFINTSENENGIAKKLGVSNLRDFLSKNNLNISLLRTKIKTLIARNNFASNILKKRKISEDEIKFELAKNNLEDNDENRFRVQTSLSIEPSEEDIKNFKNSNNVNNIDIRNEIISQKLFTADADLIWFLRKTYYVEIF